MSTEAPARRMGSPGAGASVIGGNMQERQYVITWYLEDDDLRSDDEVRKDIMACFGIPAISLLSAGDGGPDEDAPERRYGRRHRPLPPVRSVELAEAHRAQARAARNAAQLATTEGIVAAQLNELYVEMEEARRAAS